MHISGNYFICYLITACTDASMQEGAHTCPDEDATVVNTGASFHLQGLDHKYSKMPQQSKTLIFFICFVLGALALVLNSPPCPCTYQIYLQHGNMLPSHMGNHYTLILDVGGCSFLLWFGQQITSLQCHNPSCKYFASSHKAAWAMAVRSGFQNVVPCHCAHQR